MTYIHCTGPSENESIADFSAASGGRRRGRGKAGSLCGLLIRVQARAPTMAALSVQSLGDGNGDRAGRARRPSFRSAARRRLFRATPPQRTSDFGPDAFGRPDDVPEQGPDDGVLEAGQKIGQARAGPRSIPFSRMIRMAAVFRPLKLKSRLRSLMRGRANAKRLGIAGLGQLLDDRAAGIAEVEELGDLVQGLAGRVVPGPADDAGSGASLSAGRATCGRPRRSGPGRERRGPGCSRKALSIWAWTWSIPRTGFLMIIGQPLGEGEPDEKRADEARALGHGEKIHRLERKRRPRPGSPGRPGRWI